VNSVILQAAARLLTGLILLFSVYILIRGHDESGGGFIGALIASAGFAFYQFAYGAALVRQSLPLDPQYICLVGLAAAVASGLPGMLAGEAFLTGLWSAAYLAGETRWAINTGFVFDVGVYLVVIGAVLMLLLALEDDEGDERREKENKPGGEGHS